VSTECVIVLCINKGLLWKTRNDIVFNGAFPRLNRALLMAREEADLWLLAGAKGLSVFGRGWSLWLKAFESTIRRDCNRVISRLRGLVCVCVCVL
jgi:hypothetical protein